MRLRKNLKRTAAAALALGMTVSTAVPAANAAFYVKADNSRDVIEITKEANGSVTVTKNGTNVEKEDDDGDDVIIYGGDKKPTYENKDKTSSTNETKSQNADDTADNGDTADLAEDDADAGFATMDLTPEDYGDSETADTKKSVDDTVEKDEKKADDSNDKKADADDTAKKAEQPERTVTKTGFGTVTEYGDYDIDPDTQVTKPAPKAKAPAVEKTEDTEKDDEKAYTVESSNSITKAVEKAAKATVDTVIKIINKAKGSTLDVTLNDVNIDASNSKKAALRVEGEGDVTLELDGKNVLKSGNCHAGIEKNSDSSTGTLTITDDTNDDGSKKTGEDTDTTGQLEAKGGWRGAGIGGRGTETNATNDDAAGGSTSNITITGGDINATGGSMAAGIGGGGVWGGSMGTLTGGSAENIHISGGKVTATGSLGGAGIGGGGAQAGQYTGAAIGGSADVTIDGDAIVDATGGSQTGAGIGGGGAYTDSYPKEVTANVKGGDAKIDIKGGTISAIGGNQSGAAIGGGGAYTDAFINATGDADGGSADITISGGVIEKAAFNQGVQYGYWGRGAGIGGGGAYSQSGQVTGGGAKITMTDGTIKEADGYYYGAAIGGGGAGSQTGDVFGGSADITISGGTIEKADGFVYGTGIGGGGADSSSGKATGGSASASISGGTVNAKGGNNGAGIGGGGAYTNQNGTAKGGDATDITISSGTVTAKGGGYGAGIGGGGASHPGGADYAGNNPSKDGAAIGGKAKVSISGGIITAIGKLFDSVHGGVGIGGGSAEGLAKVNGGSGFTFGGYADITISGGTIEASGGGRSSALGGGHIYGYDIGSNGDADITVSSKDSALELTAKVSADYYNAVHGTLNNELASSPNAGYMALYNGTDATYSHNEAYVAEYLKAHPEDVLPDRDNHLPSSKQNTHVWKLSRTETDANGRPVYYYECKVCGAKLDTSHEHSYTSTITKEATCKEAGERTYTCSVCGDTYTEAIPKTEHKFDDGKVTREPTCKVEGEKTFTCSACGGTYTEAIPKTEHKYDDGKVTREPTCKVEGEKTFTCSACGDTYTEAIPKTEHKYDDGKVTKEPACEDTGIKTFTCAICKDTYTEVIATLGHLWDDGTVTTEPTCTEKGEKTFTCTREGCGKTKAEEIAPNGHKWSQWETVPGDSSKEYRTCEVCKEEDTRTVSDNNDNSGDTISTGLQVLTQQNANILQNTEQVQLTQINSTLYFDVAQDTASLRGILLDLNQLRADNVDTIVFSTAECTSTLYTAELAAFGGDDTPFVLTHSGSTATLTIGGVQHNELIH